MKDLKKSTSPAKAVNKTEPQAPVNFVFSRSNYIWMFIGMAFLVVGYLLMIGGGSDDPNVFNEEMFNFRRITLSPLLITIGLVIEIYAIMKKPSDN